MSLSIVINCYLIYKNTASSFISIKCKTVERIFIYSLLPDPFCKLSISIIGAIIYLVKHFLVCTVRLS